MDDRLLIRCSADQKAAWDAAAKDAGMSLSRWARFVLTREAGSDAHVITLDTSLAAREQRRAGIYGTPEQQREMATAAPAKREARGYSKAQSAGRKEKER